MDVRNAPKRFSRPVVLVGRSEQNLFQGCHEPECARACRAARSDERSPCPSESPVPAASTALVSGEPIMTASAPQAMALGDVAPAAHAAVRHDVHVDASLVEMAHARRPRRRRSPSPEAHRYPVRRAKCRRCPVRPRRARPRRRYGIRCRAALIARTAPTMTGTSEVADEPL